MSNDNFASTEPTDDHLDQNLDGLEDTDDLTAAADANRPYGEVTAEDLATDDLIADGADPAGMLEDDDRQEHRADGVLAVDEAIITDDLTTAETIEDRIQQEEPDPASDIVPPDAGRRA